MDKFARRSRRWIELKLEVVTTVHFARSSPSSSRTGADRQNNSHLAQPAHTMSWGPPAGGYVQPPNSPRASFMAPRSPEKNTSPHLHAQVVSHRG